MAVVQAPAASIYKKAENLNYVISRIEGLGKEGCDLVVFPELALCGYIEHWNPQFRRLLWESAEDPQSAAVDMIVEATKSARCYAVVGYARRAGPSMEVYNSAIVAGPDGLLGVADKIHIPLVENYYFTPGNRLGIFHTPIATFGVQICYDMWFPEMARVFALKGADIVVTIASVHSSGGTGEERSKRRMMLQFPVSIALYNYVYSIFCNAYGTRFMGENRPEWQAWGCSRIISPSGEIVAEAGEGSDLVIRATLKRDVLLEMRSQYSSFKDRRPDFYKKLVEL